ncbi:hypothetical protein [Kitasatospora sp. NBC_01266]|uniref:hypothetical protein n=1 Tax=Kitasatospora sp. NBC_01266 TaxID=2903572 RepID=UPI002E2EB3E7|nr:hypothetical protein [Kitasatospora sp. NBC_01266]
MGIGMLALYAALAVVALWLLAELLLQNRAPLHWRGVALGGFLLVAAGMAVHSVPVIAAGALAFALGQAMVTLSVKRGYSAGWSLRGADGSLPGPLAKVPLLGAVTGGVAAVAVTAAEEKVGEVGPIEEPEQQVLPEPVEEDAAQVLAAGEYGVYDSVYEQQQQPQQQQAMAYQYVEQQQFDPNYGYQQQVPVDYGYYQPQQPQQQEYAGYEQQQWQQPAYDPAQYQPEYGIPQQQQPPTYEYYQQQPQHEGWQ